MASFKIVINAEQYDFYPYSIKIVYGRVWVQGTILGYDANLKISPSLYHGHGTIELDTRKYTHSEYFYIV